MSRQVLKVPDVAATFLTQSEGDTAYATAAHLHTGTYLPLAGGTVTGVVLYQGAAGGGGFSTRATGDTFPRWNVNSSGAVTWGPGGAAGTDTTLQRTGAGALRVDTHLAVGASLPASLSANYPRVQAGIGAFFSGHASLPQASLSSNSYVTTGDVNRSITNAPGIQLSLGQDGYVRIYNCPAVPPGTDQTMTARLYLGPLGEFQVVPDAGSGGIRMQPAFTNQYWLSCEKTDGRMVYNTGASGYHQFAFGAFAAGAVKMQLAATGTLTMTTDANQASLVCIEGGTNYLQIQRWPTDTVSGLVNANAGHLALRAGSQYVVPYSDNFYNMGHPSIRWSVLYAVTGTINTSSVKYKDPLGDLDPAVALAAVLRTPARRFKYKGTERVQSGYYLEEADPLFTIGPDEASPSNDTGILLGAIQALCARLGITL